jgi:hypothetical protein
MKPQFLTLWFLALQPQRNELVMKVDVIRVKLSKGKGSTLHSPTEFRWTPGGLQMVTGVHLESTWNILEFAYLYSIYLDFR